MTGRASRMALVLLLAAICTWCLLARAGAEGAPEGVVVRSGLCSAAFSRADGSLIHLARAGGPGPILRGGERGLWRARFRDGTEATAAGCAFRLDERTEGLSMAFDGPELDVRLTVTPCPDGVDLSAELTPRRGAVLEFALPARLRFDPSWVERLVFPMDGNVSVGAAFNRAFFERQPPDDPAGWEPRPVGPAGYEALYGGPLRLRADGDPPVPLRVTPQGREWLGAELADRLAAARAVVNRPPAAGQADLVLVDSPNGPYFSANPVGGGGLIWRLGGPATGDAAERVLRLVGAVVGRLVSSAEPARRRVGLIALKRGPDAGGWSSASAQEWREALGRSCAAAGGELVDLDTVAALTDALRSGALLAVVNPYGEWTPVPAEGGMEAMVETLGCYVRHGGQWFEVAGHPFFYELSPLPYYSRSVRYPPAFADLLHLDTAVGAASVYGLQPHTWEPWETERLFVPGRLGCGADERGGYIERSFATFVEPGQTWRAPTVRLTVGGPAAEAIAAYCRANRIERPLEDKVPPELLDRFRRAVLVYYGGDCRRKMEQLDLLPAPAIVHFADYLKGGFDKQYPDHLPPNPRFGTAAEFRAFIDRCHVLGHLVMPYTNPTWWCDDPRGPTFRREGEAPLLRTLDGELSRERYGENGGYTVCHWHPAVRAANRETLQGFTGEFPVDVLFLDQCGARGWRYDTNPASPAPYAYTAGLLSMVAEDSRRVPLSTESGWDGVVNYESQLCGMSWAIVPTENAPPWRRLLKDEVSPRTWEVFPLAQHVAHERAAMVLHDLAQFVTNRRVLAWTLGLGFSMSYRVEAARLSQDGPREWLRWLDRLQKSVCARYVGEPVRAFRHEQPGSARRDDDGVIRAAYGPIKITANLGPESVRKDGLTLAPYGFHAAGPDVVAANLTEPGGAGLGPEGVSFVSEERADGLHVWVYASPGEEVAVLAPGRLSSAGSFVFDGGARVAASQRDGAIRLALPADEDRDSPPAELADRAPLDWPGEPPAVGVLDMGLEPALAAVSADEWVRAFERSRLAVERGVPVRRIRSYAELRAALAAGPAATFVIVNPCAERFPAPGPGRWRETLDAIRRYVRGGGCWWETGGYSFYYAHWRADGGWHGERVGPAGMAHLGLPVASGADDPIPVDLALTPTGRHWLGEALSRAVEGRSSAVNRGLPRDLADPGHVALVRGGGEDFIGGYRLDGWGWLWRIGGFAPRPEVAMPVVVAACERLYAGPPASFPPKGARRLYHAVASPGAPRSR